LQKGTTPLVKLMGGVATRNFQNFHHPEIEPADFLGPRAVVDNRFKLVLHDRNQDEPSRTVRSACRPGGPAT
jgi:hypothetical protein